MEREIDRRFGAASAVMQASASACRGEEGAEQEGEALDSYPLFLPSPMVTSCG